MGAIDTYLGDRPDPALAGQLVEARFGKSEDLVYLYSAEASATLDALTDIDFTVPLENLDFDFDSINAPNVGDAPIPSPVGPYADPTSDVPFPDLNYLAGLLNLVEIVLNPTTLPTLDAQAPSVTLPDAPDDPIPDVPTDAPTVSDKDIPTPPDIPIPAEPVLEETILPVSPIIESFSFEGTLPTADLIPPEPQFIYQDQAYQSDLADAIKTKLYNDVVYGGTGLGADIEQDIWDRLLTRLDTELNKTYQQTLTNWEGWGNDMPDGILAGALNEIQFENNRNRLDANRDIAIEQARLAQQNTQFAVTNGLTYEKQQMDFINQINNRAFEVARYRVQSVIDIYNIRITAYNAQLEQYKAAAQVFEARVRAELAKAEIYRVQMEGAKLHSELQAQKVAIYTQRINALRSLIDLYNAQLEAVRVQLSVDDLKIKAFRASVDAATAQINGVTSKYNLYQAQIAGERAKVDLYGAQVGAFESQVRSAKVESDVNLAEMQALIDQNKDKYQLLASAVEKYKSDTQYELGKGEVSARVYASRTGQYEAEVGRETDYLRSKIDVFRSEITKLATEAEVAIKEADINLRAALASKELQVEALKAAANIQSQKVASALTSVSASAQIGYNASLSDAYGLNVSDNYNTNISNFTGFNTNYNYNL